MGSLPFGSIINPEDAPGEQVYTFSGEYGLYKVIFDPICHYLVWADHAQDALDMAVDYCEEHGIQVWLDAEEVEELEKDDLGDSIVHAGNHGLPLAEDVTVIGR